MKTVDMNEGAMVDILYRHHQHSHTEEKAGLCHFPLSLTPNEEALRLLHESETMGSLTWLCPWQQYTVHTFTEDLIHAWLPLCVCKVAAYQFITEDDHHRYDQEQQPFLSLKMLQDILQEQLSKGEISVGTWGAVPNSQKILTFN